MEPDLQLSLAQRWHTWSHKAAGNSNNSLTCQAYIGKSYMPVLEYNNEERSRKRAPAEE
jgi:hypothetical protein